MKQKFKQLQSFVLLLILSVVGTANVWGDTTLFNVDFTQESAEVISTAESGATFVAKTYQGYNMSFGVKSSKPINILSNGGGLEFTSNNCDNYQCIAIPLTLTANKKVTATITLASSGKIKYNWVSGTLPSTPAGGSGTAYGTAGTTNTLEYTPTTAGSYVLYLGRNGANDGKVVSSIVITQESSSDTYSVTYDGNDNTSGSVPSDATAYAFNATVTVLGNTGSLAKTGYTFNGWNTEDDGSGTGYSAGNTFSIHDNTTLYAQWAANNYTVTIDANEGTGGSPSITATYGSALPSFTAPTKDGNTLTGYWTAASGGTKIINANGSLVDNVDDYTVDGAWIYDDDITLYAQWQEKTADKFHFKTRTSGSTTMNANSSTAITVENGYASALSGGSMSFTTAANAANIDTKGVQFKNNAAYVTITLDSPL